VIPELPERPGFDERMSREEINSLPIRSFPGEIFVVRRLDQLEAALADLADEKLLGFDTETRPNFKKGQNNLPALLQLAGEKSVYIFQLKPLGLPGELRQLLADPAVIKAGVSVNFDLLQLKRLDSFQEEGFVELATVARESGIRNHGLRGLAAVLLGFRISKSAQRSNWGAENLTEKQLRYAATDAWIGREIYLRLEEMGVIYPELSIEL
jgi:ribonuclease D